MTELRGKNEGKLDRQAQLTLARKVDEVKRKGNRIIAVEEMSIVGKMNSRQINLELNNASAVTEYEIVFGTPVGIADEYADVPFSATIPNIMFTGLADLSDQQGLGLGFMQLLNKRFVRKPVFISHIELITPDTAKGQSQKSETVKFFEVPYNSTTDTASVQGKYIPVYTEYTAVTILGSGVMVGEFNGFYYKMLTQSNVKMNIYLAAIDTPTFMYNH
jgi:hypothetical protein